MRMAVYGTINGIVVQRVSDIICYPEDCWKNMDKDTFYNIAHNILRKDYNDEEKKKIQTAIYNCSFIEDDEDFVVKSNEDIYSKAYGANHLDIEVCKGEKRYVAIKPK